MHDDDQEDDRQEEAGSWYDGGNLLRSTDLSLLSFNLLSMTAFLLTNLMNSMISAQLRYLAGKWW